MNEVITCLEHALLPIVDKRAEGDLSLTFKHAQMLAKLASSLPKGAIQWAYKGVKLTQFCGVIQLGNVSLEILPKLYAHTNDPQACRAALIKMIDKAGLFKLHKGQHGYLNLQRHTLLDIFIVHFCESLRKQVIQGKAKDYNIYENDLPVLRGRLLIEQQLKRPSLYQTRFACRFEELSENTLLNQIIKYTLRLLLSLARAEKVRQSLTQQLELFREISYANITPHTLKSMHFTRNTERYRDIFLQCSMFIQGLKPDVLAGSAPLFSLLFNMNSLFENWVASTVMPMIRKRGWRLSLQGPRKYLARRPDWSDDPRKQGVFSLKPDIVILDQQQTVVAVIDAKWKRLDSRSKQLGVAHTDVYQLHSYIHAYHIPKALLIYPKQAGIDDFYCFQLEGRNDETLELALMAIDITSSLSDELQNLFVDFF